MITVTNLRKSYKGTAALEIEHLSLGVGELVGLVGNNGAGKTTFFRLLLDLVRADNGNVYSKGTAITSSEDWKKYSTAYIDEGFLIEYLTPEEYFEFVGSLHGQSKQDVRDFISGFENFFDGSILGKGKYIRDFSKGNQCKIGIAAAMLPRPELLLLDEPFANLDPSSQHRLASLLKSLSASANICILVSSHDLNHISQVCNRVLLMEKGKIIRDIAGGEAAYDELINYFKPA